jgi:hypothetical protein
LNNFSGNIDSIITGCSGQRDIGDQLLLSATKFSILKAEEVLERSSQKTGLQGKNRIGIEWFIKENQVTF